MSNMTTNADDDVKVYKALNCSYYPAMNTGFIIQKLHYNYSNISHDKLCAIVDKAPCVIDMGDGTLWQISITPDYIEFGELERVQV